MFATALWNIILLLVPQGLYNILKKSSVDDQTILVAGNTGAGQRHLKNHYLYTKGLVLFDIAVIMEHGYNESFRIYILLLLGAQRLEIYTNKFTQFLQYAQC